MFKAKVVEKFKSASYIQYISSGNRAVYEIMWKNMVEPERPQLI